MTFTDPTIVEFSGDLDVSRYAQLRDRLNEAWDGTSPVIVDLLQVHFLDSTCLRELLLFRRRVQRGSAAFATIVTKPNVLRLLEITGLNKSLNVATDLESVLRAFRRSE